jgi:hypothetical protein
MRTTEHRRGVGKPRSREPSLHEVLSDPIVNAMMRADGVSADELAGLLARAGPREEVGTRAAPSLRTPPPHLLAAVRETYRCAMAEHRAERYAFDLALALVLRHLSQEPGMARRTVASMLANEPSAVAAFPAPWPKTLEPVTAAALGDPVRPPFTDPAQPQKRRPEEIAPETPRFRRLDVP